MDTYCTNCGEPWELDCLHDPEGFGLTLSGRMITACDACEWHAARGFKLRGTATLTAALHDVMGDDIDGVAAMLDDIRYMGGM